MIREGASQGICILMLRRRGRIRGEAMLIESSWAHFHFEGFHIHHIVRIAVATRGGAIAVHTPLTTRVGCHGHGFSVADGHGNRWRRWHWSVGHGVVVRSQGHWFVLLRWARVLHGVLVLVLSRGRCGGIRRRCSELLSIGLARMLTWKFLCLSAMRLRRLLSGRLGRSAIATVLLSFGRRWIRLLALANHLVEFFLSVDLQDNLVVRLLLVERSIERAILRDGLDTDTRSLRGG